MNERISFGFIGRLKYSQRVIEVFGLRAFFWVTDSLRTAAQCLLLIYSQKRQSFMSVS